MSNDASGVGSTMASQTGILPPSNSALRGFNVESRSIDATRDALLQKPGSFSVPNDGPDDVKVKRLILIFMTATFYASFAKTTQFDHHISADLEWGNQRLVGLVSHRYVTARQGHLAEGNHPWKPIHATYLNTILCSYVDKFIATRNNVTYVWTNARKEYVANLRAVWKEALRKSFRDLVARPPAIPDPGPRPDWMRAVVRPIPAPSGDPSTSSQTYNTFASAVTATLQSSVSQSIAAPGDASAASSVPEEDENNVSLLSEQDEIDAQVRDEVIYAREQAMRQRGSILQGKGNGPAIDHKQEDKHVHPGFLTMKSSEHGAAATSAHEHSIHAESVDTILHDDDSDIMGVDTTVSPGTQPTPTPHAPQAHPSIHVSEPMICDGPAWLEDYIQAKEVYEAFKNGGGPVPPKPPEQLFFTRSKLYSLLTTSMGMYIVFEDLLRVPELMDNWHRDYEHCRDMAAVQVSIFRRCVLMVGDMPQEPAKKRMTTCCEWHKLYRLQVWCGNQVSTLQRILEQAVPVRGMYEEYRNALVLARRLKDDVADALGVIDLVGEVGKDRKCGSGMFGK